MLRIKKRTLVNLLKWLLILYGVTGILVYYLQDKFIFHPEPLDRGHRFDFGKPFREINLEFDKHSNLNIIQFTVKDSMPRGVVLYFHGNMKNISFYAPLADIFLNRNYEVWMLDYPGFGKSTGPMEEKQFYEYAEQLYKLAARSFSPDSIILYGKSLGTGLAAYTASEYPARRLILETPYYSFTSLGASYFPIYPVSRMIRFKIPTNEFLLRVSVPVSIFHGTTDRTISYRNAVRLKTVLKPGDEFITIEGAGHNGLYNYPGFQAKLDSLLQ